MTSAWWSGSLLRWWRRRRERTPFFLTNGEYIGRALDLSPVAFWPLGETSGATADNAEGTAGLDGTYGDATFGGIGILPDGYAMSGGYVDVLGAASAFNGAEGSVSLWFKPSSRAVWEDKTNRRLLTIFVNANNYILAQRTGAVDDLLQVEYKAGGVSNLISTVAFGQRATWSHLTVTWSKAENRVRLYVDGVLLNELTGLGTWAGTPLVMVLGAGNLTPTSVWGGQLAMAGLWDRELAEEEALLLSRRTYEMPASGDVLTARYFALGGNPVFSPDGSYLLYERTDATGAIQIYRQAVEGGPETCLTNPAPTGAPAANLHTGWAAFHPTHDWAVCQAEIPGHALPRTFAEPVRGLYNDIWLFKPGDNTGWTNLTNYGLAPAVGVLNPRFSIDGTKLIWAEKWWPSGAFYKWGKWRMVVADFDPDTGTLDFASRVSYTPFGDGWYEVHGEVWPGVLLFSSDRGGTRPYAPDVYLYNTQTGGLMPITDSAGKWDEHGYTTNGLISYSSSRAYSDIDVAAIQAGDYSSLMGDVYLVEDGITRRLTRLNAPTAPESGDEPAYPCAQGISPDGSMVVFARHLHGASYGGPYWRRVYIVHRQA